jgi:flagellin
MDSPVDLRLQITGGTTTTDQVLTDLTSQIANNDALKAAGITLANGTVGESLVFQNSNGERFTVSTAGDTSNILGLGTYALASQSTATSMDYSSITSGGAWGNNISVRLEISVNGNATLIDTGALAVTGASAAARVTSAVGLLNAYFASDASAQAAGLRAVDTGSTQVRVESTNGTAFRVNTRAGDATDGYFGRVGAAITANKTDALRGTSAQGSSFTGASGNTIVLAINGTNTTVDISAAASVANLVTALDGVSGIGASTVNSRTVITGDSANTKIEVISGTATALTALGISVGDTNISDSTTANSGGAYNTALGTNNDVFRFNVERNGADAQTLNIVVNDSTGAQRSLAVTLQNSLTTGASLNARSVDEAIQTINTALQNSGDTTLKSVVAVKETTYDGRQDGIRFLSANSTLRVAVGAVGSSTSSAQVGVYDGTVTSGTGQGSLFAAEQSDGGAQLDISAQASAENSVTSLAEAVQALGNAQAAVGKGQNMFNYAINLASTQMTNMAAAESRIRDADLAAEAANLTKAQILQQAGVAALAQANSAPQAILSLLRG